MHSDPRPAFDNQPDGHSEETQSANQGANYRQHAGMNPDHDAAKFFRFVFNARHIFRSYPTDRAGPWLQSGDEPDKHRQRDTNFWSRQTNNR